MQVKQAVRPRVYRARERPGGRTVRLTEEIIADFLRNREEKGCTKETLKGYRRHLLRLYRELPENKEIRPGTLTQWRDNLVELGYASRTVNSWLSAANSLMEFCGAGELRTEDLGLPVDDVQPELTRSEYLRLLTTARSLEKERAYLLVKVFATANLGLQDLPNLNVQAVETGVLTASGNGVRRTVHIPAVLREELRDYIGRQGILDGPVFVTRNGRRLNRTAVTADIQSLAKDARVAPEKCNPRCLRKLYQSTMAGIEASIHLLVEQAHDRLLEREQMAAGWEEVKSR